RVDAAAVIAAYAIAFAAYGSAWPMLLAGLAGRAFVISQLDHAPHHGTPLGERVSGLNMMAPRWLRWALLGFNLHRTHHEHPHLPWSTLISMRDTHADDVSVVRAVLRQWKGPIALPSAPRIGE